MAEGWIAVEMKVLLHSLSFQHIKNQETNASDNSSRFRSSKDDERGKERKETIDIKISSLHINPRSSIIKSCDITKCFVWIPCLRKRHMVTG